MTATRRVVVFSLPIDTCFPIVFTYLMEKINKSINVYM